MENIVLKEFYRSIPWKCVDMSDGGCICSRLDEKHSLLSGDSILYALVKNRKQCMLQILKGMGLLYLLECSWGHVDDVSSLSALYQSVLWDCGA